MQWYYVADGQKRGPLSENDFRNLVKTGTIDGSTLVWHEGMSAWSAYSTIVPDRPEPGQSRLRVARRERIAATISADAMEAKTQASQPDKFTYGGFWLRAAALLLDTLIQGVFAGALFFGVDFLVGYLSQSLEEPIQVTISFYGLWGLYGMLVFFYEPFFLSRFAATPGKAMLRMRVVRPKGGLISGTQAFGRYLAKAFLSGILLIGYLMAAFDAEKRALHDRMARTRVIRKPRSD